MEISQEQADRFCGSLKAFHDSLADDEKQVLEQILEQASAPQERQSQEKSGRPFFEKFLRLNPRGGRGEKPEDFVTLKFPSDSDEPADSDY